ncbi:MAG: hypothetical protein NUV69_05890, partial [Candidatus Curtissbacteria bacterium]|nr:hypothetical protein [Candidatus Curtissbacteria bacterium]
MPSQVQNKFKVNKKTDSSLPPQVNSQTQDLNPDTLLPTEKIIRLASVWGVDFGPGNPQERVRYFIKLGLLPHAVRRTARSSDTSDDPLPPNPVGHLPYWTVKKLLQIHKLNTEGLSYPEIAQKLQKIDEREEKAAERQAQASGSHPDQGETLTLPQANLGLLTQMGMSQKEIEEELEKHKQSIEGRLQEHKKEIQKLTQVRPAHSSNLTETDLNRINNYQKVLKTEHVRFGPSIPLPQLDLKPEMAKTQNTSSAGSGKGGSNYKIFTAASLTVLVALATGLGSINITHIRNAINVYQNSKQAAKTASVAHTNTLDSLSSVLAASDPANRLYIDAITEVKGETTFLDPITAPNIVYSVTGGTGITVTAGQNPVVALSGTVVNSVNTISGPLTISGSGSTSISTSGSIITITSTDKDSAEADTLATVTGRGATTGTASTFSGGLTLGGNINLSDSAAVVNLSNAGTLAFKDATNTLFSIIDQGAYGTIRLSDKGSTNDPGTCTAGDIYFNGTDATVKACTATNTWEALDGAASGDVVGPASATDNAIARFDSTTGKLIKNSGVIIDDSNNITGVGNLTVGGTTGLTLSGVGGQITFANGETIDNDLDGTIAVTGALTVNGATSADITSTTTTATVFDSTVTTLSLGSAATTLNLGDGAVTGTIDIGGVTADGTSTIRIATEGTSADVITIGNSNAATTVAITGGDDWSVTAAGAATFASL